MTAFEAPKRIRRFQAQSSYSGHATYGLMHAGKYRPITGIHGGYKGWTPACYSDEQLAKLRRGNIAGRPLTAQVSAPITCPRCVAMIQKGEL